jgi:hypothetical protein
MNAICASLAVVACAVLTACGGGGDGALPFASTPVARSCTPQVVTVGTLGDSTQRDMGDRIQRAMDARFGAGAVIVTNYGVGGTNSGQAPTITDTIRGGNYGLNEERCRVNGVACDTATLFGARMAALHLSFIETPSPLVDPQDFDEVGYAAEDMAVAKQQGIPVADVRSYVLSLSGWQQMIPDGVHPNDALRDLIAANVVVPVVVKLVAPLRCEKVAP